MRTGEMTAQFSEHDALTAKLLGHLHPQVGAPTCARGCSNCCRVAVGASTGEVLALLQYVDEQPEGALADFRGIVQRHIASLERAFSQSEEPEAPPLDALTVVWGLGPCAFLQPDGACGIYPARPHACRAVHVWHENTICGGRAPQTLVPAELIEIRNAFFLDTLMEEVEAGRFPFWGQLTLVAHYLLNYGNEYARGDDLEPVVDERWLKAGLITFPGKRPRTQASVRRHLKAAMQREEDVFRQERPYGLPRALSAKNRDALLPVDSAA
ncbi:MAG TPA: YkgJ family cysteine cluster protein [Rhodothermales bacterium]|nr:YkgJ family cysteine cluster protein [Rhodothermales bacterium]